MLRLNSRWQHIIFMIIAIWGNSGSGSSTLAVKLASHLAQTRKGVLLVDANFVAPQAQIWFPKVRIEEHESLTNILSGNIDTETVASKITMINDYLGVVGYTQNLTINAIPIREDTHEEFLNVANSIADYVIVDCQSNITQDILSFTALDVADVKILTITPDLRGLAWYNSNYKMVQEKWANSNSNVIKILSKVRSTSPAEAVEKAIGDIQYYLPYNDDIADELYSGTTSHIKYSKNSKKYGEVITSLAGSLAAYS